MTHAPNTALPANIGIDKWSNIGFHWQGVVDLSELERLSVDTKADAPLRVSVDFGRHDDGVLWLSYEVLGSLSVVCQRCLNPLLVDVSGRYVMAILTDETKIEQVFDKEYILLSELGNPTHLPIKDLLEDELILTLPLSPRHDDCELLTDGVADTKSQHNNPFAVLADFKVRPS